MSGANSTRRDVWQTVAVTALPRGWRNVYRTDNGLKVSPCPAILLQENRGVRVEWDDLQGDAPPLRRSRFEPAEPPYETQAVFADSDFCLIWPAGDNGDCIGTVGPDQDPADVEKDIV